jgi:hypothetical protein
MRSFRLFYTLILFCVLTVFVNADTLTSNQTISFQGYLTGQQAKMHQGMVKMRFRFYEAEAVNPFLHVPIPEIVPLTVNVFEGNYTTKIELSSKDVESIAEKDGVWIEVVIGEIGNEVAMSPRIEMTAAPYAMLVKGLKYDAVNDVVIIGFPNIPTANPGSAGGLVVSGSVLIGGAAAKQNGIGLYVDGTVRIDGNVTTNTVSADQVFGAIWN